MQECDCQKRDPFVALINMKVLYCKFKCFYRGLHRKKNQRDVIRGELQELW